MTREDTCLSRYQVPGTVREEAPVHRGRRLARTHRRQGLCRRPPGGTVPMPRQRTHHSRRIYVFPDGFPQPVVERPATQGQPLANHAEAAAVVQGDGGVEAAPAVELHVGPEGTGSGRQ